MAKKSSILFFTCIMALSVCAGIAVAESTPDDATCAVFLKVGRGMQVIPRQGKVQTRLSVDAPVFCGSMVITHQEPVWIKLSNQSVVKLGPDSFVEIPSESSQKYHLYRGELLISAPSSLSAQVWSTPNAEVEFSGGVAWFQYASHEKKTTVGCFNRSVKIMNKFNSSAAQEIHAGEMSHLAIQEAQVKPSQPSVMSHITVTEAMARLKLTPEDEKQFVSIVKQVFEDRGTALASEIENWEDEESSDEPSRSIASVPQSSKHAIDPKEADFSLKMMKKRLYGDPREVARVENERSPASTKESGSGFSDEVRDSQKKKFKVEVKRISKEIDSIRNRSDEE